MTILVTGCGGYVGNVLVRDLLDSGFRVRGMDNFHKGQCDGLLGVIDNPSFTFMYGDVSKLEDCKKAVDGVEAVIHLAGIVGFPACSKQPVLSKAVNLSGTANILNYLKGKPMVFASTGSVYGVVKELCTEDVETNPQSQYGLDKLNAEKLVRSTTNTISLRFATGFGVSPCMRVNLLVNDLVYQAHVNKCFTLFEADAKRTFIHVKDMSRAFQFSLNHLLNKGSLEYNVFNCGDDNMNWSKRQLAEYIKEKTGCFVTYADIGKDADARDYEVSYKRIKEVLKFNCIHSMENGINELIKTAPLLKIKHQYE